MLATVFTNHKHHQVQATTGSHYGKLIPRRIILSPLLEDTFQRPFQILCTSTGILFISQLLIRLLYKHSLSLCLSYLEYTNQEGYVDHANVYS
jgi:hypothetical protein